MSFSTKLYEPLTSADLQSVFCFEEATKVIGTNYKLASAEGKLYKRTTSVKSIIKLRVCHSVPIPIAIGIGTELFRNLLINKGDAEINSA